MSSNGQPDDLIVVVPGFLGSELQEVSTSGADRPVWGYGVLSNLLRRPWNLVRLSAWMTERLRLDPDDHDPERPSKVRATLLNDPAIIPGFWGAVGYQELLNDLRATFPDRASSILGFPYDWRYSNEISAAALKDFVDAHRRDRTNGENQPGVILIGHSMGGLVSRYYAEVLDDPENPVVKRVITAGTPYRGAAKALEVLANGRAKLGPVTLDVSELAPTWPSVGELLPTYDCVGPANAPAGTLTPLDLSQSIGRLDSAQIAAGRRFHDTISKRAQDTHGRRPNLYVALYNQVHTSTNWVTPNDDNTVTPQSEPEIQSRGDGTVPVRSAYPPEWDDRTNGPFSSVAGRHVRLHRAKEAVKQMINVIDSGNPRAHQAAGDGIAADAPEHVEPQTPFTIEACSIDDRPNLALDATIRHPDGGTTYVPVLPVEDRPGRYRGTTHLTTAGIHYWSVEGKRIDAVGDYVMCLGIE